MTRWLVATALLFLVFHPPSQASVISQQYQVSVNSVSNSTKYTPSVAASDVFTMNFEFDDAGTALNQFDGSLNITQTYNLSDFPEYSLLSDFSLDVNPLLPDPFLFGDPRNFDINYDWYYIKPGATPDQNLETFEAKHSNYNPVTIRGLEWSLFMFYQPSESINQGVFTIRETSPGGSSGPAAIVDVMRISFSFEKVPSVPEPGAVPVPATVWLFGTGMLGLIGFCKGKKTA